MTHTPGPWKIGSPYGVLTEILDENDLVIAMVWTKSRSPRIGLIEPWPEGEANARLIAARPDLLEALEMSKALLERLRACNRDFADEIDETIKQALAAIAKTRGGE